MGTISNKLQRVLDTKEDIRQALIEEGKDVPADMPFRLYPEVVRNNKLPGLVGMYMGKGYTNESMSKDPVWYDTSGNGNHIALKNFAWKLDSGCGKYAQNFKLWNSNNPNMAAIKKTGEKVEYKYNMPGSPMSVPGYVPINSWNNIKTKIKAGNKGLKVYLVYNITSPVFLISLGPNEIGIIPQLSDEELVDLKYLFCGPATYVEVGEVFSFEQIPDYDGAICFDGVDDYGICETFPILTKEKGYTVMALRSWISRDNHFEGLVSNVDVWNGPLSSFLVEYKNSDDLISALSSSFGNASVIKMSKDSLVYQTSNEYNGSAIRVGNNISGSNILMVARSAKSGLLFYSSFALYALAIFDHDTTTEERQPVIDYWKKEFPELFPDQAWTVTGKTNSDADRATIKNITGNGNDLVLTNFGYAENSGYGKWPFYINTSKLAAIGQPYGSLHFEKDGDYATIISNSMNSVAFSFTVRGLSEGTSFAIRAVNRDNGDTVLEYNKITVDGVYRFSYENTDRSFYLFFYNGSSSLMPKGDFYVDILQDPDYEGYLVTDGVDDKIQSSAFKLGKDFTIVGDWELLSNISSSCGIVKSQNTYLYNSANGLSISINNPRSFQSFGTKSLHAICSDGRLYDRNWVEYKYIADPNFLIVDSNLNIGFNLNNYTQIAFRNAGIYNNIIMNKEQCIRAYNYLQTIKNN